MNQAEQAHLAGDLMAAELDVARLNAALSQGGRSAGAFHPPAGASATEVAMQRSLLIQQVGEQRAKLAALDRQKAQKEAELATANATVGKLETLIPVLSERVEIRRVALFPRYRIESELSRALSATGRVPAGSYVQKSRATRGRGRRSPRLSSPACRPRPSSVAISIPIWSRRNARPRAARGFVKATQRTQLQAWPHRSMGPRSSSPCTRSAAS